MKNLALIGMMGCGKTTLAKALARKTGRNLFSSDAEIEKESGMSISEIFNREGEQGFRERERKCVVRIAARKDLIIDCGGGIVTLDENTRLLKKTCALVYIRRPLDSIMQTINPAHRPLARDPEQFGELYHQREPIYEEVADYIVDNHDFELCLKDLERILKELP